MATFSDRMGYTTPKSTIQTGYMDDQLRTALWNSIYETLLKPFLQFEYYSEELEFGRTFTKLWKHYFSNKIDERPHRSYDCLKIIKKYFFEANWYEVYNFIEFIINNNSFPTASFVRSINLILEKELSGYRVISNVVTPIISDSEIEAIETAMEFHPTISHHIDEALKLLANKENPDYRNSIKESISAVEALARLITGNPKSELGAALNQIEKAGKLQIHGALKNGFSSIYGWTSDAQGIRHSLIDAPALFLEDAIFMLVACSAFINYLHEKAIKAGINLQI